MMSLCAFTTSAVLISLSALFGLTDSAPIHQQPPFPPGFGVFGSPSTAANAPWRPMYWPYVQRQSHGWSGQDGPSQLLEPDDGYFTFTSTEYFTLYVSTIAVTQSAMATLSARNGLPAVNTVHEPLIGGSTSSIATSLPETTASPPLGGSLFGSTPTLINSVSVSANDQEICTSAAQQQPSQISTPATPTSNAQLTSPSIALSSTQSLAQAVSSFTQVMVVSTSQASQSSLPQVTSQLPSLVSTIPATTQSIPQSEPQTVLQSSLQSTILSGLLSPVLSSLSATSSLTLQSSIESSEQATTQTNSQSTSFSASQLASDQSSQTMLHSTLHLVASSSSGVDALSTLSSEQPSISAPATVSQSSIQQSTIATSTIKRPMTAFRKRPHTVTTIVTVTITTTVTANTNVLPTPTPVQTQFSTSLVTSTGTPSTTAPAPPQGTLKLTVKNNIQSNNVHAYLTGLDTSGNLVMLTTDGTFYIPQTSSETPTRITANVALPLNVGQTTFTIPDYITSARLWFSEGTLQFDAVGTSYGVGLVEPTVTNIHDPNENVYWGFVELTYDPEAGLFANLSFVDFISIGVGMKLTTVSDGTEVAQGMPSNGAQDVCNALTAQAQKDGQPWDKLCETDGNGHLIRVLSPSSYLSVSPAAFNGYFNEYVTQVWETYTTQPLYIDAQNYLGKIECQVNGSTLVCEGDNRGYAAPTSEDIFSCNTGPFAIEQNDNAVHLAVVPRLCAAFNRATLLIEGGNVQPSVGPSAYYTVEPNNMYSRIAHEVEVHGQGYAFPYDDVAPSENQGVAGIVASPDPVNLIVSLRG